MIKRIGILYIGIGRYEFFWKDFYQSAERYFLQGEEWVREYYVFTDSPSIYGEEENVHIHRISQANLGWPQNTMMRFHLFLRIQEQLKQETDYLFFFNANMEFKAPAGPEMLPMKEEGLAGVLHSGFCHSPRWTWTYERRSRSACYIPFYKGTHYFQGSLWGGRSQAVLRLCDVCRGKIDTDMKNGIIPVWHDESAVNRYFVDYPPEVVLDTRYNWSEEKGVEISPEIKILLKDKTRYFSLQVLGRGSYEDFPLMPFGWRAYVRICRMVESVKRRWLKLR